MKTPFKFVSTAIGISLISLSSAEAAVSVASTQQFNLQSGNGVKAVTGLGAFDAGSADKLVVVVSTEHAFNNTGNGNVASVSYNSMALTQAFERKGGGLDATVEVWYLDNPGAIGAGTIDISAANPNGGIGAAYAVNGTLAGFGATGFDEGWTGTNASTSVGLTTTAAGSLVIAGHMRSGNDMANGGGNGTGTTDPTGLAPLTGVSSGRWGNQWGSHASGYQIAGASGTLTTSPFSSASANNYRSVAVEFLMDAEVIPEPTRALLLGLGSSVLLLRRRRG